MFFSEKKRHRRPRSLSFGNCGWEGPLWLGRQSGQSDGHFPASQAGTRRLKEERHQAELDCRPALDTKAERQASLLCSCSFFPLLPPLPSSPSSRLTPAAAAALAPGKPRRLGEKRRGFLGSFLSAFIPFPQVQQHMGRERKVLREKNTPLFGRLGQGTGQQQADVSVAPSQERQLGGIAGGSWHPLRADKQERLRRSPLR